jgi:hypothetical protein
LGPERVAERPWISQIRANRVAVVASLVRRVLRKVVRSSRIYWDLVELAASRHVGLRDPHPRSARDIGGVWLRAELGFDQIFAQTCGDGGRAHPLRDRGQPHLEPSCKYSDLTQGRYEPTWQTWITVS